MRTRLRWTTLFAGVLPALLLACQDSRIPTMPAGEGAALSKAGVSAPPADPAIAFLGGGLSVMNADGSNQAVIVASSRTTTIGSTIPSWSPDARSVLFSANRSGMSGLWISDVSVVNGVPVGSNVRFLTVNFPDGSHGGGEPSWSPLGDEIAVVGPGASLYLVPPAGGSATVAYTSAPGFTPSMPRWSPDASKLVFVERTVASPFLSSLLVLDRATATVDTVLSSGSFWARYPSFSRDGSTIAYDGFVGSSPEAVYTVAFTGTIRPTATPTQVVSGMDAAWSPDGLALAYVGGAHSSAGVYALSRATGSSQLLAKGGGAMDWRRF